MRLPRDARAGVADLVCLSHLRWDFVYQRPNHLMARAARGRRVFFVEEPERRGARLGIEATARDGLTVVRPVLPIDLPESDAAAMLEREVRTFLARAGVARPWLWYYTPMALPWTSQIDAEAVIYDCMDELSGFKFAPSELAALEARLMDRADIVFTGGRTIHEAKRDLHRSVYLFPSSVDLAHFGQARSALADPADQVDVPRPRIGYFGVIDERIDLEIVAEVARARPDWQVVMVGPVAKIDERTLPRADNIHWLGMKAYAELPAYLGNWDVAMMPFAINEATRHISPTKTPEYLAGGRPVVSTRIRDVVHPYADEGLVYIPDDPAEFVAALEQALACDVAALTERADRLLAVHSWDATWAQMEMLVRQARPAQRRAARIADVPLVPEPVPMAGRGSAALSPVIALSAATPVRSRVP